METVYCNGQKWALGLRWMPPQKWRPAGMRTLREKAHAIDEEFDVCAWRRVRKEVQFGFGTVGGGWKEYAGAHALCACLSLPDTSFLGLFQLRSTQGRSFWWLLLKMNGQYGQLGDRIFHDEEEAKEAVRLIEKTSGLSVREFGSHEESLQWIGEYARLSRLERWILDKGALANLNRRASSGTVRIVSLGVGIIALVVGIAGTHAYFADAAFTATAQRLRQERQRRQDDIEKHPEKFFAMEWQGKPAPAAFAASCLGPMMELPLSSNGWELAVARCNGKSISLEWKHASGAAFTRPPQGAKLDDKDARTARSQRPVGAPGKGRWDGEGTDYRLLLTRDEAIGELSDITQSSAAKLKMPKFRPPKKQAIDKSTSVTAPWRDGDWGLSSIPDVLLDTSSPAGSGLFQLLGAIPGLSIDAIVFDGEWSVKGSIYAR